jgi:glycosidase
MKKILWPLLLTLLVFISCNKDSEPNINEPTGPSQYGTPFSNLPETQDIIMYEVNLRAFSSTGDIAGITNRLDEIDALGVNVIWLMPIHPIGDVNSVNSPYSVKNYFEVSPEFGTLDDLRAFVEAAHERDIAVIMDWVANHTSWDNPWIANRDWYTQVDGEIVHPPGTNWQDVADLDFSNEDMRLAMIDALKYWVLEANIDGFRCDAADYVPLLFWRQAIDSLESIPNRDLILLAEGARSNHFDAGFQMNYAWDFYGQIKSVFNGSSASSIFSTHEDEYENIPAGAEKLRFTTNHDESAWDATPMVIFNGKDGAMAASVITTYLGGVPLIYGSQEVGRSSTIPFFSNSPINWSDNPDMLTFYQELMTYYEQTEALKSGELISHPDPDVVLFERKTSEKTVLVMVNVRSTASTMTLPENIQNTSWKGALDQDDITLGTELTLSPYQYYILE